MISHMGFPDSANDYTSNPETKLGEGKSLPSRNKCTNCILLKYLSRK